MWYLNVLLVSILASSATSSLSKAQEALQVSNSLSSDPLISLHKSLVEHQSITGEEGNMSLFLNEYLESKGFTVERQPVEGSRENILAYIGKYERLGFL